MGESAGRNACIRWEIFKKPLFGDRIRFYGPPERLNILTNPSKSVDSDKSRTDPSAVVTFAPPG